MATIIYDSEIEDEIEEEIDEEELEEEELEEEEEETENPLCPYARHRRFINECWNGGYN